MQYLCNMEDNTFFIIKKILMQHNGIYVLRAIKYQFNPSVLLNGIPFEYKVADAVVKFRGPQKKGYNPNADPYVIGIRNEFYMLRILHGVTAPQNSYFVEEQKGFPFKPNFVFEYGKLNLSNDKLIPPLMSRSINDKCFCARRNTEHYIEYFATNYIAALDLHKFLCTGNRFPERVVKRIFKNLIQELKKVHNKAIYHSDLKLENILLDKYGKVHIIDFGLSCYCTPEIYANGLFANGTYGYYPPEIW